MAVIDLGKPTERLGVREAQALLDADQACHHLGLQFELRCAQCQLAWGSDKTRIRNGRVVHYEISCGCKHRVFDALDEA